RPARFGLVGPFLMRRSRAAVGYSRIDRGQQPSPAGLILRSWVDKGLGSPLRRDERAYNPPESSVTPVVRRQPGVQAAKDLQLPSRGDGAGCDNEGPPAPG